MRNAIFTLSVDDGHPLDMRMADILLKHELQATFYVPVKNCEGHPVLRPPALRELSTNFEIGSHTLSHKFLKNIQIVEALYQINSGKKRGAFRRLERRSCFFHYSSIVMA